MTVGDFSLRSAGAEARAQIDASLQLLSTLPRNEQRHRIELRAQILLHRVGVMTSGRTAPETRRALKSARELCATLDNQVQLPSIIFGQWYATWSAAAYDEALGHAEALSSWTERHENPTAKTFAEYALALCLLNSGSLREAKGRFEAAHALDHFDGLPGVPLAGYWAEGIVRVSSLLLFQICLFLLGCFGQASKIAYEGQAAEQAMSQPYARAIALVLRCRNQALQRDAPSLLETAGALVELTGKQGYPDFAAHAVAYRGWALVMTGELAQGIQLVRSGIERCRAVGYLTWHSQLLMLLAECYWRAGDTESALRTLSDAEHVIAQTGERILEAELHRLRGEIYRKAVEDPCEAEKSFMQSLEIARGQGARLLELRAATSLARQHIGQNRREEAHEMLATVLRRFPGNSECPEITAARELLGSAG
jgi:tetratricopeptide (TPR) repeat protein